MLRESREYERKPLLAPEQEGIFFLEFEGERYTFDKVNDVSISGVGLQLPTPLLPASTVLLGFDQEDIQVRLQATVMWRQDLKFQDPINGNGYRIGIRFNPFDQKNSSLLFIALRKFIDPFGAN